jgi:hypothetical protein
MATRKPSRKLKSKAKPAVSVEAIPTLNGTSRIKWDAMPAPRSMSSASNEFRPPEFLGNVKQAYNVGIKTFTPTEAQEILDHRNTGNRGLRTYYGIKYMKAMLNGEFQLNGETLIFDEKGCVMSGQNRLTQCVRANRDFTTYVVWGMPRAVFATLDSGCTRMPYDILAINGEKHCKTLASVLNKLYAYYRGPGLRSAGGKSGSTYRLANHEIQSYLNGCWPTIREYVDLTSKLSPRLLSHSQAALLYYLFATKHKRLAKQFFDELFPDEGSSIVARPVIVKLRGILDENKSRPLYQRIKDSELMALVINAWNVCRSGRRQTTSELYWFKTGNRAYPVIK